MLLRVAQVPGIRTLQGMHRADLFLNAVCKFLDHRVGEHFASDALDLVRAFSAGRPSASESAKYLPWRTAVTSANPILCRAFWMVWPCGSRTDVFNVT